MTERDRRDSCERWFVQRGLPHLIDGYNVTEDVLTRSAPLLGLVVLVELSLTFGDRWTGWHQALVFAAGVTVVIATVAAVNRIRGRRPLSRPDTVGGWEVAAFVAGPAVVAGLGTEGPVLDAVLRLAAINVAIVAIAVLVTAWGVVPMIRWSVGQLVRQLGDVANLLAKSLPILLLFSAFLFLNAEMWQVANDLTIALYVVVVVALASVGAAFVALSVNRFTFDGATFANWESVRQRCSATPVADLVPDDAAAPPDTEPLGRRARINVGLLLFVAQGIQILLIVALVTAFYVAFGMVTVREETLLQWTTAGSLGDSGDWVSRMSLFGSEIVFTRQLVFVAGFIGTVSGLQFAVQVVTDEAYRAEFAAGMTEELREALAVRAVYLRQLVPTSPK